MSPVPAGGEVSFDFMEARRGLFPYRCGKVDIPQKQLSGSQRRVYPASWVAQWIFPASLGGLCCMWTRPLSGRLAAERWHSIPPSHRYTNVFNELQGPAAGSTPGLTGSTVDIEFTAPQRGDRAHPIPVPDTATDGSGVYVASPSRRIFDKSCTVLTSASLAERDVASRHVGGEFGRHRRYGPDPGPLGPRGLASGEEASAEKCYRDSCVISTEPNYYKQHGGHIRAPRHSLASA